MGGIFLEDFDILLTLLKSNTMEEVPNFKRSGRRPKHSTSEVSIQAVLRLFSFLPSLQAKSIALAPELWPQCHDSAMWKFHSWMWQTGFPQVGKISDKGVWEYTCSLTWFTHSLQPGNGGNHKPLQAISFFKSFHSYSSVQFPESFSVPGVLSKYRE